MDGITSNKVEYQILKADPIEMKKSLHSEFTKSFDSVWSSSHYTIQFDNNNYYVDSIVDGKITIKKK